MASCLMGSRPAKHAEASLDTGLRRYDESGSAAQEQTSEVPAMPRLDLDAIPMRHGSDYPPPHDRPVAGRVARLLSEAAGLEDFVVAHSVIPPGGWSSQRHWHEGE